LNFSNFSNEAFDNYCSRSKKAHKGSEREILLNQMRAIITENFPAVPLYRYYDLMIAQKDFCTEMIRGKSNNELSRIEEFIISPECR
jgi:ABC-type oligopeptide transport system substrate-binding subunit